MHDWNVVATAQAQRFNEAVELLGTLGKVARSAYFNVLLLRVDDPVAALETLEGLASAGELLQVVARVVPVAETFTFGSPEHFERLAQEKAALWVPLLEGKSFHVRMHRRGFKGKLSTMAEEQFLDRFLLERVRERGEPARIDFTDPDLVLDIETVDNRCGMALWSREELQRYRFLKVD